MRKERKHYTGEEKVAILRRHLLDKVPVSDLCDELGLQPTGSTVGRKNSLKTGLPSSRVKVVRTHRRNNNGSSS